MRGETFRAVVLAWCAASAIAVAGEAQSVKVYKGGEGAKVTVVRKSGGGAEALVKVEGTDTRLDGRIFKVEISRWGENEDWFTYELGGTRYALITLRRGERDLYPGEGRDSIHLAYDEKATADAKPDPIVEEYQAKRGKDGGK
ncbi:MAG TPA: hypothetical protein VIG99_16315 [Myxococcaceae bacterium]|jgi:hypothetical protein